MTAGNLATHLRSETSLPRKLITVDVKMKLENTVKRPAIPEEETRKRNMKTSKLIGGGGGGDG